MDQTLEEFSKFLSYVLTAGVAGLTAFFARKKAKEDTNLTSISQAIEVWKELAESNKEHWDDCEAKTEQLEQLVNKLQIDLLELRAQNNLLKFKIEKLENNE